MKRSSAMTGGGCLVCGLGWLLICLAVGCAPAYHSYSGCSVNCKYCAPPPMPYAPYDGCECHSCQVAEYLETPRSQSGPDG